MKAIIALVTAGGIALLLSAGLPGQSSSDVEALKKEIEALKARQKALEQQVQELRGRLGQPASNEIDISLAGAKFRGNASAKVMLVEFSDIQCPFCGRHFRETMPLIDREYISTGKIRYAFKDFPIEQLHRQAFKAHEAVNCAADQNKYWPMHNRLFANPNPLGPEQLAAHAAAAGLDVTRFKECLDGGRHASTVRQSVSDAVAAGANGTPAFFVGTVNPDGKSVKAARGISGAQPYARFKQAIDALLAGDSGGK
jgi:protein-disulfide isomerase